MAKIRTTRYDVAEHLRTPEEMAAYLEACLRRRTETPPSLQRHSETLRGRKVWHR